MTQFTEYSDSILSAFQQHAKTQDVIDRKQEILDSVYEYYNFVPSTILFIGFNPAIFAAEGKKIFITEASVVVRKYLEEKGLKVTYVEDIAGQQFDCVVALDEYFTFAQDEDDQRNKMAKVCAATKEFAITTVKDYKNQDFKDREYSQPAVIRNNDQLNTYVEIHDWDFKNKNAWRTTLYHLSGHKSDYCGTFDRRTVYFKQLANFSLSTGASNFLVHKNLMYKSLLKKNYEHVITIQFET